MIIGPKTTEIDCQNWLVCVQGGSTSCDASQTQTKRKSNANQTQIKCKPNANQTQTNWALMQTKCSCHPPTSRFWYNQRTLHYAEQCHGNAT
jgi:hypothetical protein